MGNKKRKSILTQGWDISLNHGAVVQLRNGELDAYWFYTDKVVKTAGQRRHGMRIEMPTPKQQPDKQIRSAIRLAWVSRWLDRVPLEILPDFACLEDYALGADQGAHYIGEIGGKARSLLWDRGIKYRLYDPITVKMFVTHDGTAQKDLVEECAEDRWGVDFSHCNPKPTKAGKENRTTSEDLADAYTMAKMVWVERNLRNGSVSLTDLPLKEVQIFNRITKAYPINILGREWLHNPEGGRTFPTCKGGHCTLRTAQKRKLLSDRATERLLRVGRQ